ncbi:MAG: hypothetical protein FWC62_05015 [Firmicutes bacterium]|nr:hypothetical protein [Bacillota bacterium]
MNKDFKRRITHEVIIFLGLMILLFFITRLWPLVFLAVILLFICVIRLLFLKPKPVIVEPAAPQPQPEKPDTEQDILRRAFGLIQRRITEYLTALYPDARWVWHTPNPMTAIAEGNTVCILLNRAGGYRKAEVLISNLQFKALRFETASAGQPDAEEPVTETDEDPSHVNYGLMAFEWVESNTLKLNQQCNDAIAGGESTFLIPSDELPARESWSDICDELVHSGFYSAEITEDGIQIIHRSQTAERK